MDERRDVVREEPVVERERTTVINTGGRGGGGTVAALLALVALAVVAFLVFGQGLLGGDGDTDVNIDVKAPDVDLPTVPVGNQSN